MKPGSVAIAAMLALSSAIAGTSDIVKEEQRWLESLDRNAEEAPNVARIDGVMVAAPQNRWVLLRQGKNLCAIRFTSFRHERAQDSRPPSYYRDSFFATYDWFFQDDGNARLVGAENGEREASRKPNLWRFERGNRHLSCGAIRAEWWYPNVIMLINRDYHRPYDPKTSDQPNGVEVALTGWKHIEDVNAADSRLIWRSYQPDRAQTTLPVSELPGT